MIGVIYTDRIVPAPFAGYTIGPLIFIRPAYRDDAGLLAHELVHRWQWFRTLALHSVLYAASRRYRLAAEIEAYREQATHYADDRRPLFAHFIAERYGLGISTAAAMRRLLLEENNA